MKQWMVTLVVAVMGGYLFGQIQTPAPSPTAEYKQKVGLTDVMVQYSRPSAKGRTIFGADKNAIVPFGTIWRTGANSATKLSFGDDVKLGGQAVKKGDYALLTTPGATEWKIMLYPYESTNWGSYPEKTPAVTIMAKPTKLASKVETFTIDLNDQQANLAHLDLIWEMTKVSVPLEVEVEKKVMANIERVMGGPTANDYFQAASYYHDNKKDLNQALAWIKKANEKDPQYWMLRREALILADLGRKPDAIAAATRSLEMAKKAKNDEYVRMNEASIAEWKK